MSDLVCDRHLLECSFGSQRSVLRAATADVYAGTRSLANIMDYLSMRHIYSFGLCRRQETNPMIKQSDLDNIKCVPMTLSPWKSGCQSVLVAGQPALNTLSRLHCESGGLIRPLPSADGSIQIP